MMPSSTLEERIGADKLIRASDLLKVAAHPQRLMILDLLGTKRRLCVNELSRILGMEQAILSQHLTLMRARGLLFVEREGKYGYYGLKHPGFIGIIKDLEHCCEEL